jgi:hypothetical protein
VRSISSRWSGSSPGPARSCSPAGPRRSRDRRPATRRRRGPAKPSVRVVGAQNRTEAF